MQFASFNVFFLLVYFILCYFFFFLHHTVNVRVDRHVSQYLRRDSHELTTIFICLFMISLRQDHPM